MATVKVDSECKSEMDDSGCVQDVTTPHKSAPENGRPVELLDLSDDVMLHILQYCSHMDLKALGYTCPRLGALVLDHTLWARVEGLGGCGPKRLAWLLAHALRGHTKALALHGLAKEADCCLGIVSRNRAEELARNHSTPDLEVRGTASLPVNLTDNNETLQGEESSGERSVQSRAIEQAIRVVKKNMSQTRCKPPPMEAAADPTCPGPQFTLTPRLLKQLRIQCTNLEELYLDYININCSKTRLCHFPRGLKKLSLRGLKCYNLPSDRCFLFKIHDYFTKLEFLDVSECEWLEPASILGLSKIPCLTHLVMCECYKMSEFVAYASLASRYGFRTLKIMDLRRSPVGDSEVSALSWAPCLEELYVSVAENEQWPPEHTHYRDDGLASYEELVHWEKQIPEHFSTKEYSYLVEGEGSDDEDIKESSSEMNFNNMLDSNRVIVVNPRAALQAENARNGENGAGDAGNDPEPGPSNKKRKHDVCENQTKSSRYTNSQTTSQSSDSSDDDDDEVPTKKSRQNGVNQGASTSKSDTDSSESSNDTATPTCQNSEAESNVGIVDEDLKNLPALLRHGESEPLHKILYVNVSRRLHTVYKLSMPVCTVYNPEDAESSNIVRRGRNIAPVDHLFLTPARLDRSSLVTDVAIRSFGESDNDNVNYIQIGPNGPSAYYRRPTRTNLRILSVTGFRTITNRTLEHLATAAPYLTFLDLSRTRVTKRGVEKFKTLKPDCEVVFSEFE